MPNRLAQSTSPYLLQHVDNPVDWYPWAEEAFERARQEDKPVLLSVGYSSCHWCHVMAHESFEDEGVAELLKKDFVSIKVDREERPDVDEAYMTAVQLATRRGGWPMTVFMTPDKRPFFAGTYFPRDDRGSHPGFVTVCRQLAEAWRTRRPEVEQAANGYAEAVREALGTAAPAAKGRFDESLIEEAVEVLIADFDRKHGGFGAAPKFPPHGTIEFLLRYAAHPSGHPDLRESALAVGLFTLERMALGGIHDHVGGGFHRYSTDAEWLLPHFEKMLYDNALLLGNYVRGAQVANRVDAKLERTMLSAAEGIVRWLDREMTSPEGLYYSALDADSEGEEGKYYVWSQEEVRAVLGGRADAFMEAYRFEAQGNFEDEASGLRSGTNIPHLSEAAEGFEADLAALHAVRDKRVHPGLDDKALIGWNGLMIASLAEAGLVDRAARAAHAILTAEQVHGELPHQITRGVASGNAFLEDYAAFINGLLRLAEASSSTDAQAYRSAAERLAREMVDRFEDQEAGAFFATTDRHEVLFGRTKPVMDQPIPSGNALAVRALVGLGDEARARRTVDALLGWMQRAPHATEALFAAALPLVEAGAPADSSPATITILPSEIQVRLRDRELVADTSGRASGAVIIDIPADLHINGPQPPAAWLVPTLLDVRPLRADVAYPEPVRDRYEGRVEIPFTVELPSSSRAEEFEIVVRFQACTESECLLPQERRVDGVVLRG